MTIFPMVINYDDNNKKIIVIMCNNNIPNYIKLLHKLTDNIINTVPGRNWCGAKKLARL
jgi:hypothetical protein